MTQFTLIQKGDTVFDKIQSVTGVVMEIDYTTNVAVIKPDSDAKEEVVYSKLFNLTQLSKSPLESSQLVEHDVNQWWSWVQEFQRTFDHPAPEKPTMLTEQRIQERNEYMYEECQEMLEAKTLVDQVDAALDKLYFALGDLVELGVKPHNLLKIVQEANMGKLHNVDGEMVPVYNEVGKVKKPDNWEEDFAPEPKLKEEIERQLNN